MKFIKIILSVLFLTFLTVPDAFAAAAGELDPAFGHVGFKIAPNVNSIDRAHTVLRQPDGKIILVGNQNEDSGARLMMMRFNPDGTLDTTFDGDGIVVGNEGESAFAAALQPDGKIVVTGRFGNFQGTFFAVYRYNADGSPDATFSGDGIFTDNLLVTGSAVAVQTDGKIVAAGTWRTGPSDDFAVFRLNPDGTLDATFDGDGRASTAVGDPAADSGNDDARAIALQPDGKILVGGSSPFVNTGRDFSIVRYNPDGSLDTTFDGDGIVTTSFDGTSQNEFIEAITLDSVGRIIAVGHAPTGRGEESFVLARYNADGSLDATFDGDGKLIFKTKPGTFERAYDAAIQPDGKIIVVGHSGFRVDFAVFRLNPDGTLDPKFGTGGVVYVRPNEDRSAFLESVALAPNGDIIAGGYAEIDPAGRTSFAFARFDSAGVPAPEFGTYGYVTDVPLINPNDSYQASSVLLQPDGRILVGGDRLFGQDRSQGYLVRYEANGSIDRSFNNRSGAILINLSVESSDLAAIALQPDGKIICVGSYDDTADAGIYLFRVNADGTVDRQFGNNGVIRLSVLSGGALGRDVRVLSNGKILVAGATANIATQIVKPAVFRFNADGSLDTSFGSNGIAATSFSQSNDLALALDLQTDGKIIIAGASNFNLTGANGMVALARFSSGGTLDTSFGSAGKVLTDVGPLVDTAADVKIQPDGRIVIGGASCSDAACDGGTGFVFRYNPNGSFDTTFDGDGRVILTPVAPVTNTAIGALALQPDGRIVGTGALTTAATQSDTLVIRLEPDGSFDPIFGTGGIAASDIGGTDQFSFDVALQPDGKIITAGSTQIGAQTTFAVWRFLGDGAAAPEDKARFDFDGDGRTDVGIFRSGPGEWWYLRSSDDMAAAFQFGTGSDQIAPADFTGDGATDIAFFRPGTGEWFVLRSEDNSFFSFPFGTQGDLPVPGDFDGDGTADPAVFRPATATWFILNSSGSGTTIQQFGADGDIPVVGDYDGDGQDDLAIFRPGAAAEWFYQRSSDGQAIGLQFGTNGDKPVPADYTGDGRTDVAFWREPTGEWFIIRSEDDSFFAFPFGQQGDLPVPGDYDGDGRADAAVFRPSTSTWFKMQTTDGFKAIDFGAAGDIPVPNAFIP